MAAKQESRAVTRAGANGHWGRDGAGANGDKGRSQRSRAFVNLYCEGLEIWFANKWLKSSWYNQTCDAHEPSWNWIGDWGVEGSGTGQLPFLIIYIYINKKNTAHGCKFSSSSLFPELMHWRPTTKNEIWSRPKCQQGPDDYVCTCLGGSISKCSPKSKRSRCLATFLGYFLRNGIYIYI